MPGDLRTIANLKAPCLHFYPNHKGKLRYDPRKETFFFEKGIQAFIEILISGEFRNRVAEDGKYDFKKFRKNSLTRIIKNRRELFMIAGRF